MAVAANIVQCLHWLSVAQGEQTASVLWQTGMAEPDLWAEQTGSIRSRPECVWTNGAEFGEGGNVGTYSIFTVSSGGLLLQYFWQNGCEEEF